MSRLASSLKSVFSSDVSSIFSISFISLASNDFKPANLVLLSTATKRGSVGTFLFSTGIVSGAVDNDISFIINGCGAVDVAAISPDVRLQADGVNVNDEDADNVEDEDEDNVEDVRIHVSNVAEILAMTM